MEEKNSLNIFAIVKNLTQTFFKLVTDLKNLAAAEAQLAISSLATMVFLYVLGALLSLTTWLSILGMIIASLIAFHFSLLFAFFFVTLLNVIAVGLIALYILRMKENLKFKATRRQLLSFTKSNKDTAHDKLISKN
jgi:predicted membrane protein